MEVTVGSGPGFVAFSPGEAPALALVANTREGTVSVLSIEAGGDVSEAYQVEVGSYPAEIAFTADGSFALVVNTGNNTLSRLTVNEGTPPVVMRIEDDVSL